jgi:hypothetical protein
MVRWKSLLIRTKFYKVSIIIVVLIIGLLFVSQVYPNFPLQVQYVQIRKPERLGSITFFFFFFFFLENANMPVITYVVLYDVSVGILYGSVQLQVQTSTVLPLYKPLCI